MDTDLLPNVDLNCPPSQIQDYFNGGGMKAFCSCYYSFHYLISHDTTQVFLDGLTGIGYFKTIQLKDILEGQMPDAFHPDVWKIVNEELLYIRKDFDENGMNGAIKKLALGMAYEIAFAEDYLDKYSRKTINCLFDREKLILREDKRNLYFSTRTQLYLLKAILSGEDALREKLASLDSSQECQSTYNEIPLHEKANMRVNDLKEFADDFENFIIDYWHKTFEESETSDMADITVMNKLLKDYLKISTTFDSIFIHTCRLHSLSVALNVSEKALSLTERILTNEKLKTIRAIVLHDQIRWMRKKEFIEKDYSWRCHAKAI